jgi:flagellar motor protein MotB
MRSGGAPVWALSFADLCILLLGFFVMLHAQSGHQAQIVGGIKQALSGSSARSVEAHDLSPASMFEPGEALMRPQARSEMQALGRHASALHARVRIESVGTDRSVRRFDGWELAAARTAAIARAIQAGGLSDAAIMISIPEMTGETAGKGQRIAVEITPGV